jgi:hypothetical protein
MEGSILEEQSTNKKEVKRRFQLWVKPSVLALVKKLMEDDNCQSQSEFIEKAVIFYAGYLSANENKRYLPNVVTSTLKGLIAESDNRMGHMLYKIAVELAITMNLVAASSNIDKIGLERLRGNCAEEVKRVNGLITFDDAYNWQKG